MRFVLFHDKLEPVEISTLFFSSLAYQDTLDSGCYSLMRHRFTCCNIESLVGKLCLAIVRHNFTHGALAQQPQVQSLMVAPVRVFLVICQAADQWFALAPDLWRSPLALLLRAIHHRPLYGVLLDSPPEHGTPRPTYYRRLRLLHALLRCTKCAQLPPSRQHSSAAFFERCSILTLASLAASSESTKTQDCTLCM